MTREQAKENLIGIGIEEPTDEQISAYLNQVNGESKRERDRANKYKSDAERVTELEKLLEEKESEKLSDTEKIEREIEKLRKELADKNNEIQRSKIQAEFSKLGFDTEEFASVIDAFVASGEGSDEKARTFVTALSEKNKSSLDEAKKQWEQEKLKNTPNPGGNSDKNDDDPTVKFAKSLAKEKASNIDADKSIIDYYA